MNRISIIAAIAAILTSWGAEAAYNTPPNVSNATGTLPKANGGTGASVGTTAVTNLYSTAASSPVAIPNLNLWLDGTSVYSDTGCSTPATNTGTVGCWKDKSGSSNNFTASSAQPTYATGLFNGLAGLTFDGSTTGLSGTMNISQNYYTLFIVSRQTTASSYAPRVAEYSGSTAGYETWSTGATTYNWGVNNTTGNTFVAGSFADQVGYFSIVDYRSMGRALANQISGSGTQTDNPHIRLNGNEDASGSLKNSTAYNATPATTVYLGRDGSGNFLNGNIVEVIEYNRLLSNFETLQVEQYLSAKYNQPIYSRPSYSVESFDGWQFDASPLITVGTTGKWDAARVTSASMTKENSEYYLAYSGDSAGGQNYIGLAFGTSPANLTKYSVTTPFFQGTESWDSQWVSCARFFHDPVSGSEYLYFCGSQTPGFEQPPSNIGVATCTLNTTSPTCAEYVSNPIVSYNSGTYDTQQIFRPYVMYNAFNQTYFMFMNGNTSNLETVEILTAKSPLGPWTYYAHDPVLALGAASASDPVIIQPWDNYPYWVMEVWVGNNLGLGSLQRFYSTNLYQWNQAPQDTTANNGWDKLAGFPYSVRAEAFFDNGIWNVYTDNDTGGKIYHGTLVHDPLEALPNPKTKNNTVSQPPLPITADNANNVYIDNGALALKTNLTGGFTPNATALLVGPYDTFGATVTPSAIISNPTSANGFNLILHATGTANKRSDVLWEYNTGSANAKSFEMLTDTFNNGTRDFGFFDDVNSVQAFNISSSDLIAFGNHSPQAGLDVDNNGKFLVRGGVAPNISACGSGASASGADSSFTLTMGSTATTSCVVNFGATWSTVPKDCDLTPTNATAAAWNTTGAYVSGISGTQLTITGSSLANATYGVHCY